MKKLANDEHGIAHLGLILAGLLVVGAVGIASLRVFENRRNQEFAARQSELQEETKKQNELLTLQKQSEKDTVEVPEEKEEAVATPAETKSPTKSTDKTTKTEKKITAVTISSTSYSVGDTNVTLTANLPGSYSGTCKGLVKLTDGSKAQYFEAAFGPATTCSVSVPKDKLSASSEWKFYLYFYNKDYTVKGTSSGSTFTL
jgi:cytoskeletal protein RodZ